MAGNRKFHNKFHSANHHTLPSPHIKDSGLDPIASHQFPFIGDYVINGVLSASNNYILNNGNVRSTHLDTVRHGLPVPAGWNVLRDSTYIDGDLTITGNLTAYGELTYLHTQVHTTSATEIEIFANNSNGKTVGLLVDQHGTNDIVHIKNDGRSALFMTGSGHNPGWIGINLAESSTSEEEPNQRLTIVGSVSVVPDSNELADQTFQADAGTSGSLYIEGGLHVNDKTFLDQVTVDTTDGKFHISGSGNSGFENIFEVDVPSHLDRTHIDTTDGDFVVSGSNWMDVETPADFNAHVNLDRTHIDTTDGDFVVSGSNWMDVETPADFNAHVNLDRTHIDTTDGDFVVSGSGNMDIDAPVDFDSHVRLDQVTVDTKDGKFLIETSGVDNNNNIFDVDVHTYLDQVTVNTSDGQFYVGGTYPLNVDTHSLLDQVTIDTHDGKFLITTSGVSNIFEVDVHSHLDQVTVDTTDGRFLISGEGASGFENIFEVDVPTHLDKTVIDTSDGNFNITGNNIMDVNVDADFSGHSYLDQVTVDTTAGKFFIDGSNNLEIKTSTVFNNGSTIFDNGGVEIQTTPGKDAEINGSGIFTLNTESFFNNHAQFKKVTINTNNGVLTINGQQNTVINTPTLLQTLTADSSNDTIYFKGTNKTIFDTDVDVNGVLTVNNQAIFNGNLTLSSDSIFDVDGITRLDQTTINTTDGNFTIDGTGIVDIYTPVRIGNDVHITGDLRVDGNAYLSAGPAGVINVGDQDTDNVIFHADVNSNFTPNISKIYTLGTNDKKWLNIHSLSGAFEHIYVDKKALVEGDLDVNGKTTLDETIIDTADGRFVVSASNTLESLEHNRAHVYTDLTTYNQVSALGGPWRFGAFNRPHFEQPGQVNYENIINWEAGNVLNHPFWVQERSLFSQGLTAFGPVQIGELPSGVVDEMPEPTFEVLGNVHIREGNLKIVSDIRHLEDENTLIRFSPDKLELKVGDVSMLTLTEKLSANGHDIVEVGGPDQPVDLKIWKSEDNTAGLYYDGITGEVEITGTVGIGGKNTAKAAIGDGLDIHGSARVTETLSARNLIVDYITVNNNSFGNIGGGMGTTSTGVLTTLSGIAVSGHETVEWVNGITQTYLGTPTGIVIDVTDDQGDIQKLYSFTFEAISANPALGIKAGDVQSTTYQLAAKYDDFYTQAVVNDVEYGIIHTSDSPIAYVTSVVLSADDVPTDERIVKIIIQPEVDCNFYTHNKLIPKETPQRVDTMTTGDFDVHGKLTLRGDLSATGGMIIEDDVHVKGDLRVDGNAYLSAGAAGTINVGDSESDVVVFHADIHSDIIPDHNVDHDLGTKEQQWRQLYVQGISATGGLTVDGNTALSGTVTVEDATHLLDTLTVDGNTTLSGTVTVEDATHLLDTLTVDGNTTLSGDVVVEDNVYIKGDLRVDGNAWLSAGASGQINVGDNENDVVIFHADVHSDIIPDHNVDHDLGSKDQQWRQLYVQDISATGGLTVDGSTALSGTTTVKGATYLLNTLTVDGNTTLSGTTTVEDATHLLDTLTVDGNTALSGTVTVEDATYLLNTLTVDGNTALSGTATVEDATHLLNTLTVDGNTTLSGTATVEDATHLLDTLTVDGNTTLSGTATVEDATHLLDTLTVDGNTTLSGTATVEDATHLLNTLTVDGNTALSGTATVEDATYLLDTLTVDGNATLSGTATVEDATYLLDTLTVDGNTTLSGTATVEDATYLLDTLTVDGNTTLSGTATVEDATHLLNTLTVDGNTTLSGDVVVEDNVYIKGDLRVDGNAWLSAGSDGIIYVGDSSDDKVTFTADIHSSFIPDEHQVHDLGYIDSEWNILHVKEVSASGGVSWDGGNSVNSNSVYSYINSTSGDEGFATLSAYRDNRFVLRHDQVPNLAITQVHRVAASGDVNDLEAVQNYDIYRGDIVLVESNQDNLIATEDHPPGNYNMNTGEYQGYEKLFAPGNMVRYINGKQGPSVTFTPDDFDDTNTVHKFVLAGDISKWDSNYTSVTDTSGDWNTAYTDSQANNLDITNVMSSSADWNTAYTVAGTNSADFVNVMSSSGSWNTASVDSLANKADFVNVMVTSGSWNTASVDSLANKADFVNVMSSSGDWNKTFSKVAATSGEWDSVYSFVNSDSGTNNTAYNQSIFVNASGDTMTGNLTVQGDISASGNLTIQSDISASGDIHLDDSSIVFHASGSSGGGSLSASITLSIETDTRDAIIDLYGAPAWTSIGIEEIEGTYIENGTLTYNGITSPLFELLAGTGPTNSNYHQLIFNGTKWQVHDNWAGGSWAGANDQNGDGRTENITAPLTEWVDPNFPSAIVGQGNPPYSAGDWPYMNVTYTAAGAGGGSTPDPEIWSSQNSKDAKSVYTSVNNTSGDWNTAYTDSQANEADLVNVMSSSGNWNAAYSNVASTSAARDSVYTSVNETSAEWDAVYSNVAASSADRDSVYTSVNETSAEWDAVYSNVSTTSADRDSVYTSSSETSANWDSVYTSSSETSANWDSVYTSSSDTSANWDSVYTSVSDTSANWDSVYTSSSETSANWDTAYTDSQANNAVRAVSADWNSVYTSSSETSGEWDSVYTFINTTSATEGYATLLNGKLDESQVPNLSITDVHVVTYNSDVSAMCDPNDSTYQEIERGDVLVITSLSGHNLIATTDSPTGIYNPFDDTFDDFQKLVFPQDYVKSVNGKQGLNGNVILNPDDLDDTNTAHKFVTATQRLNWDSNYTSTSETSASWDSVYSWVNSDSATNNTDYNQTHFVNASGDTITGNLHITGDLRVDGNAYLSAGTSGIINVGDDAEDLVVFHADVDSNITPQTDVTHNLGNIDQQWQTVYVQDISASRDVNINGFTQLDKTHIDTTEGDFVVSGGNQVTLTVPLSVDNDVHITGDLRVDGNAYLSAGGSGVINVGDTNTDNVVFHADVNSTVIPNITDTYSLGTPDQRWSILHTASAEVDDFKVKNLTVTETTLLSGKSDQGPGVIIEGTPTGIFDVGTRGFEDREGDYMIPDVDITGDVVLHGSMSADEAYIYSLTASNFKAEYQRLVVNDGDLELWNGNFRQRGGVLLIESDIGHIDDENTYIRFQPDQIQMVCHDVNMIQFNEYPTADDIIILGDTHDAVDIKVQNPADNNTLYIDGDTARIGISTDSPQEKFHIYNGQAQFATGDENGAVMITSGKTDERVDKRGSIRWNTDLNRYEGYLSHDGSWSSLNSIGDTDGDTYIDIDAESEHYPDSDRLALYTAGCSAMTIHPNQTVVFAGDIQFDNITIYDNNSVTGPLTATTEFIYLSINGKDRAIRLWETPKDTREDIETFHGDSIVHIGDPCGLGHLGQIPTQTISAQNVLFSPPTQ